MRYNNTAEDRTYLDAQDDGSRESESGADHLTYARILRTIGYALEICRVVNFDLTVEDNIYTIKGSVIPIKKAPRGWISQMCGLFQKHRSLPSTETATETILLRFSTDEIQSMEADVRDRRGAATENPDPLSLSQLLRVIGAFIDNRKGEELLGVWIDDRWVTINHVSRYHELIKTTQEIEYFYDLWVKMYLQRSGRIRPLTPGGVPGCRPGEYLAPTMRSLR